MRRFSIALGLVLAGFFLTVTVAQAAPGGNGKGNAWGWAKKSAPEIDPMAAGSVLTLLTGGMLLLDAKRRNKSAGVK